MKISDDGTAMVEELNYGHNPQAYLCSERTPDQPSISSELCIPCADGFEAMHWKRRALKAETRLAELGDTPTS